MVALALRHYGAVEEGMKWVEEFSRLPTPLAGTAGAVVYCLWQKSLDARWGNGFYNDWRRPVLLGASPRATGNPYGLRVPTRVSMD